MKREQTANQSSSAQAVTAELTAKSAAEVAAGAAAGLPSTDPIRLWKKMRSRSQTASAGSWLSRMAAAAVERL